MTLSIGEAIRDGIDRVTERNGLLLISTFVVAGVASTVLTQTLAATTVEAMAELARQQGEPFDPSQIGPTPLSVPLPLPVALVLALGLALIVEALHLVAIRTFVSEERRTVPSRLIRRRIAWVTINGYVGGVVVMALLLLPLAIAAAVSVVIRQVAGQVLGQVALAAGVLVGVTLAVFLYVAFFFVRQEIAVEDKNFIEAMTDSWSLTAGNRVEVFVLVLVVLVVEVAGAVPSLARELIDPAVAVLVQTVASAIAGVVVIGVATRAYAQLRSSAVEQERGDGKPGSAGEDDGDGDDGDGDDGDGGDDGDDEDKYTGALGPEDLDPP